VNHDSQELVKLLNCKDEIEFNQIINKELQVFSKDIRVSIHWKIENGYLIEV
jgi:hypothetical protein